MLCPVTLRSYALGAVHQALGWCGARASRWTIDGEPVDLTIRSFGILAARDMPEVTVRLHEEDRWPVNGSDAVFVATLAAAWIAEGLPAPLADTTRRRACAVARRGTIGRSRGARMSPAVGPYSPVRRVGDWVITSGQVGLATDEAGAPALVPGGTVAELRQALQNVAEVLAIEGATLADVVKTTLYLVDMGEFAAVNEVWVEYFTENRPDPFCRRRGGAADRRPGRGRGLGLRPGGLRRRGARRRHRRGPTDPAAAGPAAAPLRCAAPGCQATWPKR